MGQYLAKCGRVPTEPPLPKHSLVHKGGKGVPWGTVRTLGKGQRKPKYLSAAEWRRHIVGCETAVVSPMKYRTRGVCMNLTSWPSHSTDQSHPVEGKKANCKRNMYNIIHPYKVKKTCKKKPNRPHYSGHIGLSKKCTEKCVGVRNITFWREEGQGEAGIPEGPAILETLIFF